MSEQTTPAPTPGDDEDEGLEGAPPEFNDVIALDPDGNPIDPDDLPPAQILGE